MEQLEKFRQQIEQVNYTSPQTIILNSVISLEEVRAIEIKLGVSFPEEYRQFITFISDGGIINSSRYGCCTLQSLGKYESEGYSFENIKNPFLLTRSWMPDWGDGVENAEQFDEDTLQRMMDQRWEMINKHGHIVLIDNQTDDYMQWILIVTGPCRGEVWRVTEFGVQRLINCNFFKWLELYLSNKAEDFLLECKKVEYPSSFDVDLKEKCINYLKKAKYTLNPPLDISDVKAFEIRHNISFPEEYVSLITQVGNGGKKTPAYIQKVLTLADNECLDDLNQLFFIQTVTDFHNIFFDSNNHYRHFGPKNTIWDYLFSGAFDETKSIDGPWLLPQYQLLHGCMPLMNKKGGISGQKDTGQCILILNGYYKGQVWGLNCWKIKPSDGKSINALTFFEAVRDNVI